MDRHCQHFSSISQLDLSDIIVRYSLHETRIDIWTIKNRKRIEFDYRYIFRKFWKCWIIYLLAYSYLCSFSTSFYRLGLHQVISNLMGILILKYTGWYFHKNILQNSLNFVLKLYLEYHIAVRLLQCQEYLPFSKHIISYRTNRKTSIIFFLYFIIMMLG